MSDPKFARISPFLRLLVDALEARRSGDDSRACAALVELGEIARLQIPVRGVLPLTDDRLFDVIDSVAIKHFDLAAVRQTVDTALARLEPLATRDEIEVAVDHLCAVLNVVYFNAGVAFRSTPTILRSTPTRPRKGCRSITLGRTRIPRDR